MPIPSPFGQSVMRVDAPSREPPPSGTFRDVGVLTCAWFGAMLSPGMPGCMVVAYKLRSSHRWQVSKIMPTHHAWVFRLVFVGHCS